MIKIYLVVDSPKWKKKIKNLQNYFKTKQRKFNTYVTSSKNVNEFTVFLTNNFISSVRIPLVDHLLSYSFFKYFFVIFCLLVCDSSHLPDFYTVSTILLSIVCEQFTNQRCTVNIWQNWKRSKYRDILRWSYKSNLL